MEVYSVSKDGKKVAFAVNEQSGHSSLWVAPIVAPPRRASHPQGRSRILLSSCPMAISFFVAIEGGSNFLYRMKADGTDRRKISSQRVIDAFAVSPDGRWFVAAVSRPDEEYTAQVTAFAVDGSTSARLCVSYCSLTWDTSGEFVYVSFSLMREGSYALPALREPGPPKLPPTGIARVEDLRNATTADVIPQAVDSAVSPSIYAYTRENTRRNLYRIPLP